jgi:nucleoside-diphosphate-sugar epimerase
MKLRVLMLGGTGVAGRAALGQLTAAGHEVSVLARTEEAARRVADAGGRPVTGDPDDPAELRRWLHGVDVAVDLRVRIPAPARAVLPDGWREYVRLRDTAAGRLVDAAIATGTPRVVHDTVSMVYADGGDSWLDEDAAVDTPGFMAANLACEAHLARLTAAGGVGVALRFAQFYGPDDAYSRQVIAQARRGRALVLGDPDAFSSAIHTDDVGTAVALAATTPDLAPGTYNVADDEPLRHRDLMAVLGGAAGRTVRPPPRLLVGLAPRVLRRSQRVSSERFRAATGWRPSVPSRRTGWPAAFDRVTA